MKDITDLLSAVSKDTTASIEKVNAIQLNFINALMHNQQKLMQDMQADIAETFSLLKEENAPEKVRALQQKALTACAVRAMEAYKENIAAIGTLQNDWTSLNMDSLYAISQFSGSGEKEAKPKSATNTESASEAEAKAVEAAAPEAPAEDEKQATLAIESEPVSAEPPAEAAEAPAPAKKKTNSKKTVARKASTTRKTVTKKS